MLRYSGMTDDDFIAAALANSFNNELSRRLQAIGLNECYLTAGCLFQAVWNQVSGNSPEWGVKDYDVSYYDDTDLSWDAEDRAIRCVTDTITDLPIQVEVKNQARVHLWYGERFGGDYPRLTSARSGIDRYLISCTCVGIETRTGELYAPNGLAELAAGVLRMNPLNPKPDLFKAKAQSYRQRWPWLQIAD